MSETQKRQERDAEEGSGGSSTSNKRLKSAEPDLSIVCRFDGKEETIQVHSQIIANHSNYFDTLLASGMEESGTKTVTLDDVDPNLFRSSIEILEDPESILTVSAEDMMKVAPLYNRFEFKKGLVLAENILAKFLDEWTQQEDKTPVPPELKLIGDVILFSDESNLESLIEKSIQFIKAKLDWNKPKSLKIFQMSFLQRICSFLLQNKEACLADFLSALGIVGTLAPPDLLQNISVTVSAGLLFHQMSPLNLRYNARVFLKGQSNVKKVFVVKPYNSTATTRLPDGTEARCSISPLVHFSEQPFASTITSKYGDLGDWSAEVDVVGGEKYRFLWPCTKSLALPPLGCQAVYVPSDPSDKGPYPTFELLN